MTVKINVSTAKGEIEIAPEADIHDAVDAIGRTDCRGLCTRQYHSRLRENDQKVKGC